MSEIRAVRLALRAHAATLVAAQTGSIELAAQPAAGVEQTAAFVRSTGSFLDDGFEVGMEITAAGFTFPHNNGTAVVTAVEATKLSIDRELIPEAAASGRSITVGLPSKRAFANIAADQVPQPGYPYVEEQFLLGSLQQVASRFAEARPTYVLLVHVPENTGANAAERYAEALVELFTPGRLIAELESGGFLRVSTQVGPTAGQIIQRKPGFAAMPVSIPCWLWTQTQNT